MTVYANYFMQTTLWPSAVFVLVVTLLGAASNAIVIIICHKYFRRTLPWAIIYALAILDFLTCAIVQPLDLVGLFNYTAYPSVVLCKFKVFTERVLRTSSAFLLVVIALHRYEKIWQPSNRMILFKRVNKIVVGIVIVMALTSTPCLYTHGLVEADLHLINGKVVVMEVDANMTLPAGQGHGNDPTKAHFCLALDERPRLNLVPIHMFSLFIIHVLISALLFFFYIRVIAQIISFHRNRPVDDLRFIDTTLVSKKFVSPTRSSIPVIQVMSVQGGSQDMPGRRSRHSSKRSGARKDGKKCCVKSNTSNNWSKQGHFTTSHEMQDWHRKSQESWTHKIMPIESCISEDVKNNHLQLPPRGLHSDSSIQFYYNDRERWKQHRRLYRKTKEIKKSFQNVMDKKIFPSATVKESKLIMEESKNEYSYSQAKKVNDETEPSVSTDSPEGSIDSKTSNNGFVWIKIDPPSCGPTHLHLEGTSFVSPLVLKKEALAGTVGNLKNNYDSNNNSDSPNIPEIDTSGRKGPKSNKSTEQFPDLLSNPLAAETVLEDNFSQKVQSNLQLGVIDQVQFENVRRKSAHKHRRKSHRSEFPHTEGHDKTANHDHRAGTAHKANVPEITVQHPATDITLIHAYRTSVFLLFIAVAVFLTHLAYWMHIFLYRNQRLYLLQDLDQMSANLLLRTPFFLCVLNPVLYAFVNEKFRKALNESVKKLKRKYCCCCCRKKKPIRLRGHRI